jgi:hypothetical protein
LEQIQRELFFVEAGTLMAVPVSIVGTRFSAAVPVRLFSHEAFLHTQDANYDVAPDGTRFIVADLVVGVAASLGANRLIASELWGVTPHDAITMVAVVVLISIIGLMACMVPARRATQVEPAVSLRYD